MEPPITVLDARDQSDEEFARAFIADIDRRREVLLAELRGLDELRARTTAWLDRVEEVAHVHAA